MQNTNMAKKSIAQPLLIVRSRKKNFQLRNEAFFRNGELLEQIVKKQLEALKNDQNRKSTL